ncbi:MAG: hypothetical protein J6Z26_02595 [Bacteroidales bacterium]|nr:hypothetical protein [Bacteroidales bacterium]
MAEQEQWHWQEPATAWRGIGIYHVTITVTSRQPLLGTLVIHNNNPAQARVELSPLGIQVKDCVQEIPNRHPEVRVIGLRMMPDHVHIILYVTRSMPCSIKEVVRGFWQGAKKIGRQYSSSNCQHNMLGNGRCGKERTEATANEINETDTQKTASGANPLVPEADCRPDPLFAEMPFIRPMSRRGQLKAMIRYVQLNPQRLATKRLMPGFFRVQKGIEINGRSYDGVGNTALLLSERFALVHVRNTMVYAAEHGNPNPLRDYMNSCVTAARQGTVLVSPFISPQERQVMEVLLNEQLPFVYLADNGFRDYYKPQDSLFDACAAGRVLILSPWQYDATKRHVTRADCKMLNILAEEISQHLS